MVMAQGKSYKVVSDPLLPSVRLLIPNQQNIPSSSSRTSHTYSSSQIQTLESKQEKIMLCFAPLLLLALSPLTILAQPPRAQIALPEENNVIVDLDNFRSVYRHILKVSDQDAWDCKSERHPCQQLVLRIHSPDLGLVGAPLLSATQQERIGESIGETNPLLFSAANEFVPKVRTVIEQLNEMLRREIAKGKQLRAFKYYYFLFNENLLDQADAVVKIGSIFANNKACNNPQSPAQLRAFAEKVEAIRANDVSLEKTIWDLVEDDRPSASGDHLEVTISIRGANSDRQKIE
ncbi:hypothetical protein XANCAGTX0491_004754 [Xanthoria calcicola]